MKYVAAVRQEFPECSGIGVRRDETQIRRRMGGNLMKNAIVDFRCATLFKENGDTVEATPVLSQLKTTKSVGLLGGLDLNSIDIPRLIGAPHNWKYMFLTDDGSSPNALAARILTEELQTFQKFLLIPRPCYSHIDCNAV